MGEKKITKKYFADKRWLTFDQSVFSLIFFFYGITKLHKVAFSPSNWMQSKKTALGYCVTKIVLMQKLIFRNPSTVLLPLDHYHDPGLGRSVPVPAEPASI